MEVKKFIEENFENMKSDLKELVSFNSVYCNDEAPFGSTNRKVLDKALSLMEEKGLRPNNVDYYAGFGEVGQGDKIIGILAHLDIGRGRLGQRSFHDDRKRRLRLWPRRLR